MERLEHLEKKSLMMYIERIMKIRFWLPEHGRLYPTTSNDGGKEFVQKPY